MYTIGQLAELTDFSRDTINWYIRIGLITYTRRIGQYRLFDNLAVHRLERIKELRAPSPAYPQGMPLEVIRTRLDPAVPLSAKESTYGVL